MYMQALFISDGFKCCIQRAVTYGVNLGTSHKTPRVGPYDPCVPCVGNDPDPVLPFRNVGYDVVMNALRAN